MKTGRSTPLASSNFTLGFHVELVRQINEYQAHGVIYLRGVMLTSAIKRFLRSSDPRFHSALRSVRVRLKNSGLYDGLRARQAERQDRHYKQLREDYNKLQKDVFGPPGYLTRSESLFGARGVAYRAAKADPKDAHIFVIDHNALLGVKHLKEFARSFDVTMFSLALTKRLSCRGNAPHRRSWPLWKLGLAAFRARPRCMVNGAVNFNMTSSRP